ncbi:MAG: FprA family A-type flavoprotein, partial [Oscillospiraceae bacterium]|nr:FprA family A-type flavoprotein [Oscillospiraceae bacterium]
YMAQLEEALAGRRPDYLVVHHAEPDHAGSIGAFLDKYPGTQIVATAGAVNILKLYIDMDLDNALIVKDGDTLPLGEHTLHFLTAPMVHWPEVMMSFDSATGTLFSADAFGKFGTPDTAEKWDDEARRYYFNIVGKFGSQVQAILKKEAGLDIKRICPLHGPVLTEDLPYYIDKYEIWSSYEPEDPRPFIAYATVYGHTREAAFTLRDMLKDMGAGECGITDLARDDMAEAIANAFRYGKLVLLAPSMDGGVMPCMEDFLHHLKNKNFKNRDAGLVENASFGPSAARTMKGILEEMKDIRILEPVVTIRGAVKGEDETALRALAGSLMP